MDSRRISLSWAGLLIALVAFWPGMSSGGVVEIPDPVLEAAIRDQLNIGESEPVTPEAIARIGSLLDGGGTGGVESLEGLQYATRLHFLAISYGRIRDLTPISGLDHLRWIIVPWNRVDSLDPLRGMEHLIQLVVSGNRITDITPLAELPALIGAGLDGNLITDISPLRNLHSLVALDLSDNPVGDYAPLFEMQSLESLSLRNGRLADISGLSSMTGMKELDLRDNRISDLSPLAGMTGLEYLNLWGNWICDLSPLTGLCQLEELYLPYESLDEASLQTHIPTIVANNPGIHIEYGPVPEPTAVCLLACGCLVLCRRNISKWQGGRMCCWRDGPARPSPVASKLA